MNSPDKIKIIDTTNSSMTVPTIMIETVCGNIVNTGITYEDLDILDKSKKGE